VIGDVALLDLQAWAMHRRRRVEVRTETKNQLLGRPFHWLDRALGDGGHQDLPAGHRPLPPAGAAGPRAGDAGNRNAIKLEAEVGSHAGSRCGASPSP
jgi:hypothetical protein